MICVAAVLLAFAEGVSSKSVLQECQVRVSYKSVPEECQVRVSSEKCQVRVSSKSVK